MAKIKTNGAEFKRFYFDKEYWPDGVWHDDDYITVDGVHDPDVDFAEVADTAGIVIEAGYVMDEQGKDLGTLVGYFGKWRKQQTTVSLLVEVPIGREAEIAAMVKAIGGKIV